MQKRFLSLLLIILSACEQNNFNISNNQVIDKTGDLASRADSIYKLGCSYSGDSLNQEVAIKLYKESLEIYTNINNKYKIAELNKRIGFAYGSQEDYNSEREYLKNALSAYSEIDEKKQVAIVMNFLGITYSITSEIDSALFYYRNGLELSYITRDTIEIIELNQNLGICYRDMGDYEKAVKCHLMAIEFCEKIGYQEGILGLYINVAQDYKDSGHNDLFFEYLEKAHLLIDSSVSFYDQTSFYHTYATAYKRKNDLLKAREYYLKTLEISQKNDYKMGMAASYSDLALLELAEKSYSVAEEYANLSVNIENEINNIGGVLLSLTTIAQIKYEQEQYIEAISEIKKAESLCKERGLFDLLPNVYFHYYKVYKRSGNQKLALHYCENYYELNDSLKGIDIKEKIANLEIKHQTEKKQQEIELLNKENETKKQKLKTRNLYIISLILLVFAIISTAYFFRLRGMQRLNYMESELQKYILKANDLDRDAMSELRITSDEFALRYDLTDRETEVFHLLSEGMSNTEIAEKIFVSSNTVKYHIKNIYLKLDVKNRVEALNKLKS